MIRTRRKLSLSASDSTSWDRGVLHQQDAYWRTWKPHPDRDIRKISPEFFKLRSASEERQKRIGILRKNLKVLHQIPGAGHDHRLAYFMEKAALLKSATVLCCPLLCRRFQIYFVDVVSVIHAKQQRKGASWKGGAYTLFDVGDAVADPETIDWRKLHARLRKRLLRQLGDNIVVVGMGEVEFDESRGKWQPHHHLAIYGASEADLVSLRRKYYAANRKGPRPMKKSPGSPDINWFAYMSKLTAFGKLVSVHGTEPCRTRLPDAESRDYFWYLARRRPTSFAFCINCSLPTSK